MTPRLFQADSMRNALQVVREAFGDSAVIVETKVAADGVEVWAASDGESVGAPLPPAGGVPEAPPARSAEPVTGAVLPLGGAHTRRRLRHPVLEGHPTTFQQGRFAFVGPCGAGKTSLISKFAANHVLRYGPDNIAVVTLDHWRPGGIEELARIMNLLQVPLAVCSTGQELALQLDQYDDRTCVLIDTAGVPLDSKRVAQRLEPLDHVTGRLARIVTIPLTMRASAVRHLLAAIGCEDLEAAALTHADGVDEVMDVLDELDAHLLPAYWLSTGPDIPDDIESADGEAMQRLLAGAERDAAAGTG